MKTPDLLISALLRGDSVTLSELLDEAYVRGKDACEAVVAAEIFKLITIALKSPSDLEPDNSEVGSVLEELPIVGDLLKLLVYQAFSPGNLKDNTIER
jgi:hypothetical protein